MLLEYRLGKSYFPPWPIAIACVWTEKAVFVVMLPYRGLHLGSVLVFGATYHSRSSGCVFRSRAGQGRESRSSEDTAGRRLSELRLKRRSI